MPHHPHHKARSHAHGKGPAARPRPHRAAVPSSETADPREGMVETLAARLAEGGDPAELAVQVVAVQPEAQAPLLADLAALVGDDALVALLVALLHYPLDARTQEQTVGLLARARTPLALETLVVLGEQGGTREARRGAKGALFRLRQAGVALPQSPRQGLRTDVAAWSVAEAWACRLDHVGTQAVTLARLQPLGSLAYVTALVTEDRGIVDGMGGLGAGTTHLRKLTERLGGPYSTAYKVPAAYVLWRIRQGEETSQKAGRALHHDFLAWRYLLEGLDSAWQPDLEGLCATLGRPDWLESTGALMHAHEISDWWPHPDDPGGEPVRRFISAADDALDALPDHGLHDVLPDLADLTPPPGLALLSETHYTFLLPPYTPSGEAAIERALDAHVEATFPPERRQLLRLRLLHMGYLSAENKRPTLAALIMTAAWALDPASGVAARRHPLLRAMLRKAREVSIMDDLV